MPTLIDRAASASAIEHRFHASALGVQAFRSHCVRRSWRWNSTGRG